MCPMRYLNINKKLSKTWIQYLFNFTHKYSWYDGEINDYYFGPFSYHVWR